MEITIDTTKIVKVEKVNVMRTIGIPTRKIQIRRGITNFVGRLDPIEMKIVIKMLAFEKRLKHETQKSIIGSISKSKTASILQKSREFGCER